MPTIVPRCDAGWPSSLAGMDLKVISVADGEAALKVLREAPCDLLLTDLEMPNLDGLSLVAAVRTCPCIVSCRFLILSCRQPTEFQPENRQGVTGWLVKPIEAGPVETMGATGLCRVDERYNL